MKKILFALMLAIITIPALTSCTDPMEEELSVDEEFPIEEEPTGEEELGIDRIPTSPIKVRRAQGSG